jgi:CO/xanthine dehydrogenase FAD-binding subunit
VDRRGTIGGSLAHADPAAELPSVAVALDTIFAAAGRSAADFYQAYLTTALRSEQALLGSRADPGVLRRAADAALGGLDPPGDLRATASYRRHVAGVLLRRAAAEAYRRATPPG